VTAPENTCLESRAAEEVATRSRHVFSPNASPCEDVPLHARLVQGRQSFVFFAAGVIRDYTARARQTLDGLLVRTSLPMAGGKVFRVR